MAADRPTVFVSSTIYDFRDLRSALKFWLEEMGCEVLLSDFNDFPKQSDANSYDACLQSVDRAEYFILLVGGRVGGLYDNDKKISITRMEYRRAYERLREGKIKLLPFVRQELWDIKEDRRALEKMLKEQYGKEKELTDEQIQDIAQHSSGFVNDAETIFAFLKEIGRIEEMKKAMDGKGEYPKGNWIHRFSTFRDIVDAVRREFGFKTEIRKAAITTNLIREITSNLPTFFEKLTTGQVVPRYWYATAARSKAQGGLQDSSCYTGDDLHRLTYFCFPPLSIARINTQFLDEALRSGVFLKYDSLIDAFVIGKMQNALLELSKVLCGLKSADSGYLWKSGDAFAKEYYHRKGEAKIAIPNHEMLTFLGIANLEESAVNLSHAILKALRGDLNALDRIRARPECPFPGGEANQPRSAPTFDEIDAWMSHNIG
jgi:hypothetical protein